MRLTDQIQYGDTTIEYDISYSQRKTLEINVHPDLSVSVVAPLDTKNSAIAAKVLKRASWILRQQRELELYLPSTPARKYIGGETHRYLGRQYRLKIVEEQTTALSAKLSRGFLTINTPDKTDREKIKQQVNDWYRTQAKRILPERLENWYPRLEKHGTQALPELKIRVMENRWGSCTPSGVITLNLKLMQVPKPYIDYVVVHELCHLIENNHSPRFYQILDRIMPDWQKRRQKLNLFEVS